jgi:GNAT superfamily N-acetyltransferase
VDELLATPNYREARPEEAAEITAFQIAMAKETEGLDLDPAVCARGVLAVFKDPSKGRYYAAVVGRRLAGCLVVMPEWSDWRDGAVWWIHSVYVSPEHRGRGVFTGLYEFVKALAALEPSVRGLRLYVNKRNRAAKKIYAARGMTAEHYELFEWMKPS